MKTLRPLPDARPDQVRATVGSTEYKVNAVERDERLASAPIVIVADFANTALRYHPCIVSEIIPFLRKYEARPGVTVLTNGGNSEFIHHIDVGSGPGGINLLLSRYDDAKIRQWCEDSRQARPEPRFEDFNFGARDAVQTLWGIIKGWENSNRLVRVFWIAGDFAWFEAQDTPVCLDRPDNGTCAPNSRHGSALERELAQFGGGLSKAGVTIFPILIPGTINADIRERRRRDPLVPTQYVAAVGGGFATDTEGSPPGSSLTRVVEASDQSYSVELSGPAKQDVQMLTVTMPGSTWMRPYAVDPQDPVPEEARKLPFRSTRVFLPSKNFGVRYGCGPECPDGSGPAISLLLPEFVATAATGNLYVLIDYLDPPNPFKHRKTLRRGTDPCLCIPIEEIVDRLEFRIVIYDETTQWVAASAITFAKSPR